MSNPQNSSGSIGIPEQIIEKFIEQLTAQKFPDDLIAQLRDTLLKKKDMSETAIRAVLSSVDQTT